MKLLPGGIISCVVLAIPWLEKGTRRAYVHRLHSLNKFLGSPAGLRRRVVQLQPFEVTMEASVTGTSQRG